MAIISANLQFNRGGHGLLDYSSLQANYSTALAWAKDVNSNAAVGQFIYLEAAETIEDVVYAKGPYVVDAIGENAVLTPLSKSVAGEQDLAGAVNDLVSDVADIKNNVSAKVDASVYDAKMEEVAGSISTIDASIAALEQGVADVSAKFDEYATKQEVQDAIGGIDFSTLATKQEVADGLATKVDASVVYTKGEVDTAIADAIAQIPEVPVTGVAEGDKVLSLVDGKVTSTITFGKATIDGAEYLIVSGKDGEELGKVATSEFIVDGMLDDVKFSEEEGKENYLVLTFNTAASKQDIEVDFGKYVDAYTAGEGLTLADKAFAIDFNVVERAGAAAEVQGNLDSYIASNDAVVAGKVDASVYDAKVAEIDGSISAINTAMADFAKTADVDASLALKADASVVYTKGEVDTALAGKVAVEDGKSLVADELVEKLNNLAEIKSVEGDLVLTEGALSVDLSAYATTEAVAADYVAKEDGKVLSANDFTNELKAKLDGIAEGAEVNYVKSVGANLAVSDAGELTVDLSAFAKSEDVSTAIANGLAVKLDATAKVNGVSFVEGEATIDAGDIALDAAITRTGEDGETENVYSAETSVQAVLASLSQRIDVLDPNVSGELGITSITAGNGVDVQTSGGQATVAVKASEVAGNVAEVKTDGVYVADMRSYWEGI